MASDLDFVEFVVGQMENGRHLITAALWSGHLFFSPKMKTRSPISVTPFTWHY